MQSQAIAIGTEWQSSDGSPAFMVTHAQVSNSATMQTWSHYSSVLRSDAPHFEAAKKQYIFSLANTRYALEPIAEYNQIRCHSLRVAPAPGLIGLAFLPGAVGECEVDSPIERRMAVSPELDETMRRRIGL